MNKILKKYGSLPVQVRASAWFLICSFLQKGISVLTTPIFTRLLTSAEYGQYAVFNSWLGIVTIFVSLRLYFGVFTQGLVKFEDERNVFASSMEGLCFTLVLGWTVLYLLTRNFWNSLFKLTTVQMLAMLVMIWGSAVFHFWAAEQRVTYNYRKLVLLTLAVSLAKPLVGIYFVIHAQDKVTARIFGIALVELIGYTGLFVAQMRRGKVFYSAKYWKYALIFNLPLIPHYLSQTVLNSCDKIMIKDMVSSSAAGIYGLAYSLSQIMTLFNTALLQTLTPWMYKKIKAGKVGAISGIAYMAMVIIALANLFLIILAPEAVAIFAPASYHDAIWVIPPVAMSVYFVFLYSFFANFEFYFEKTKFVMTASMISAALNVILNWIFIRIYGYYAAGYTTLFCYIVYSLGHYIFMRKICRQYMNGVQVYDPRILFGISLGFMFIGFGITFTYRHVVIRYSLVMAALLVMILKRQIIINKLKLLISLSKKSPESEN